MINDVSSLNNALNNGVLEIIKAHSYYVYIINKHSEIKCSCIDHETKQAKIDCLKCLGTGRKIRIIKAKVASQDTKLPPTFRSDGFIVARNFFIPSKYKILENDYIVDNKEVFIAFEIQNLIALEGSIPYQKISSSKKKFDTNIFLDNFYKLLKIESYKRLKKINKPPQSSIPNNETDLIITTKYGTEIILEKENNENSETPIIKPPETSTPDNETELIITTKYGKEILLESVKKEQL